MDNLMLDLIDEALNIKEEEKETWFVKDDVSADWCIDKIIESKVALRRFEMTVNTKISQLKLNLKKEQDSINNEITFFESKLREYFEKVEDKAKETKTQKTYKLPSGSLKYKKEVTTFDYNKDKLLEVAEEYDMNDYIKVKKDFDWANFKKNLSIEGNSIVNKETGEIVNIEGLGLKTKPEEFKVEV